MKFDKNYQSAAQRSCCTSRSCPGIMQFAAPSRVAARRCLVCSSFMHGYQGGRPPGQALYRTIACLPTKKGSSNHATERPNLFTIYLQKKLDLFINFCPGMNPPGHDFCPGINDKKKRTITRPLSLILRPRPCIVSRFEVCNVELVMPRNYIHIFRILDLESYAWYQSI